LVLSTTTTATAPAATSRLLLGRGGGRGEVALVAKYRGDISPSPVVFRDRLRIRLTDAASHCIQRQSKKHNTQTQTLFSSSQLSILMFVPSLS
jgi:hypothetical protein